MYMFRHQPVPICRLLSLMALFAFATSQPSLAQDEQFSPSGSERRGVHLERIAKLQPVSETQPLIHNFKAQIFSDGSVTLSGSGKEQAGGSPTAIEFEVDISNGTYKTRRLDASEIEDVSDTTMILQDDNVSAIQQSSANPEDQAQTLEKAVVPGSWWGRIRVQTVDPIFLVLAETSSRLAWKTFSNGKVQWTKRTDTCAAANPSALGTHWFKKTCQPGRLWYTNSSTKVCHEHRGSYYNWDFGLDSRRTDSSHYTLICGRNDIYFNYSWSYTDSGEAAILIRGRLILN